MQRPIKEVFHELVDEYLQLNPSDEGVDREVEKAIAEIKEKLEIVKEEQGEEFGKDVIFP